jgi:glycosyltransferase involved in cell wall biosynthesis
MLTSMTALDLPPGLSWEVIVVDNGSTDDTPAVVASFAETLPIRRVREPLPGLSHARNRGVAEASGALIVWTDDDVTVHRRWLTAYLDAATQFPDAGFFGGNITPVLEEPVSALFARNFDSVVLGPLMARRIFPEPSAMIDLATMPYGANFAVRGALQKRYRFDPHLGVSPLQKRNAEETNMLLEAIADGITGRTVPQSDVSHFIPASRQTRKYIHDYYAAAGETDAFVRTRPGYPVATSPLPSSNFHVMGMPAWYWRAALRHGLKALIARLMGNESAWLHHVREWEVMRAMILFVIRNGRTHEPVAKA